jgi:hypothetical protein
MRIPIDPAADVASDNPSGVKITTGGVFRFWYQIQESTSVGTGVLYGYPSGLGAAQEGAPCTSIPAYCFPNPLDPTTPWQRVQDGGTCTGDISITPGQIYANSAGSITVNLSSPNDFHARPRNNTTSDQPGNGIKATFRLANWGSALFSSPAWTPICTDVVGVAGTITPTSQFDATCTWSVPDPCAFKPLDDLCGPTSGSKNIDQCVLVDLASGPGGGPYHFSPQSAWRNMLFTGASTIKKVAELDTRGQKPLAVPAPNRDLYVYVDVKNMPAKRSPEDPPIDLEKLSGESRERLSGLKIQIPRAGGIGREAASAIANALAAGQLSLDEVAAVMPTFLAHVWYDTGRTMVGPAGATLKILEPQPSFGLFVWHDGDLHGWRHRFEGSTITELEPNYYRISAPTDGTVKVTTTVTACERPDCREPGTEPGTGTEPTPKPSGFSKWWIVLLVILGLALLIFIVIKENGP